MPRPPSPSAPDASPGTGLPATSYIVRPEQRLRGIGMMVAAVGYTKLVFGLILGFLVFGDFPDAITLIAAGTLVASGLYISYREWLVRQRAPEGERLG